jgi:hypothetical protein
VGSEMCIRDSVVGLSREADGRKWKCDCLTEPKRKNWATAHVKMLQCLG